jgi:predicted nucleotidyltransferase
MLQKNIQVPQNQIAAFCQKHHIRKLSLFGSALRDDFTSDSDIDVLVEFEPGFVPGFISLSQMEIELSNILERQVDLRTPAELSRYFRQKVIDSAIVQYEHR